MQMDRQGLLILSDEDKDDIARRVVAMLRPAQPWMKVPPVSDLSQKTADVIKSMMEDAPVQNKAVIVTKQDFLAETYPGEAFDKARVADEPQIVEGECRNQ